MAYKTGERKQLTLLPQSIEQFVAADDPVRAYDAFVEALDFDQLGIPIDPHKVGNAPYHPKSMLKLLVYGYSYGVRSSRKLERETHHNLSFIWLMGGLKPDHKTIAEFRRTNKRAIRKVLQQCARMCVKLDLIAGNVLFVDGTKIRANASASRAHGQDWYVQQLADIDQRIEQLLEECETTDQQESPFGSLVAMNKELAEATRLKSTITEVLAEFAQSERTQINQTDPDCATMQSKQGTHASYNVQSVVDDQAGLIVHAEAVPAANDRKQFTRQITQANAVLPTPCTTACADSGYANTDDLATLDEQGIQIIVPAQEQVSGKTDEPFAKQQFTYDREADCYYCPTGHRLIYVTTDTNRDKRFYHITDKHLCFKCQHWGVCTDNKKVGRRIGRFNNEALKEKLYARYQQAAAQLIYARRKSRVEHPFGHIKRNLKMDAFLLRGSAGVQAETSLLATCFNITRMITLLGGVAQLVRIFMATSIWAIA